MNIQKKLVSGLFWVLLANLIVKPLWIFGVEVGVQNAVGNEMYGFYYALLSFGYIFNILLDFGLTNYNTRNIAQHPSLIGKYLSGILGIKICLLALYLVATLSVGLLMGYGAAEFHLLIWICIAQFLNSLILYLRSNFEGLLLFRTDSLFSVLDRLLMILICGLLLWTPLGGGSSHFRIEHFVYAQVLAYGLTALAALILIVRKTGLRRLRWDIPFFRVVLKQSAPFALLVLLMASYNRIDPILLRKLSDDASAGIYAGAFRLLDALTMVAYLVSIPLLPVFSKICAKHSVPSPADEDLPLPVGMRLSPSLRTVFWPMLLFSVGAALLSSLLAHPLMHLLYHDNGEAYVPVFRILIFGIVPIGMTYIFGTLLTAGGHLRLLNIFASSTLLLNILINLLLIPRIGAVGSAIASLSAQSFMALAQIFLSVRLFHLPLEAFLPPSMGDIRNLLSSSKE